MECSLTEIVKCWAIFASRKARRVILDMTVNLNNPAATNTKSIEAPEIFIPIYDSGE